jgi:meso-butanediol dehydrogenase / (S,S)-butanediol dehydrogenase / diacetyl reductase
MISLAGRKILVVGGGSGIGWAGAKLAASLGAVVTVGDIDPAVEERVSSLGADASFVRCDATDQDQVTRMFAQAVDRSGRLDGVFMCVGGGHLGSLASTDRAAWDAEIAFNLTSVYMVCRTAMPYLERAGGGAIVNTTSGFAVIPGPDRMGYTAAKAGVIAFTRSLAMEAAAHKIRVNCLSPGATDTPRFRAMNGGDAGVERVRQAIPLGKLPEPIDCANVAIFLLSDAASQITGQVIHVNGGLIMP